MQGLLDLFLTTLYKMSAPSHSAVMIKENKTSQKQKPLKQLRLLGI